MFSSQPYSTVPLSSTSQMYLTHNGKMLNIDLSIQVNSPIILTLDVPNTLIILSR